MVVGSDFSEVPAQVRPGRSGVSTRPYCSPGPLSWPQYRGPLVAGDTAGLALEDLMRSLGCLPAATLRFIIGAVFRWRDGGTRRRP